MNRYCALVVTYNRPNLLLRCLNELIAQSLKLNAIIIVDNGSTSETMERLADNDYIDLNSTTESNDGTTITNYFKNDVTVHYRKLESNKGPGYAFYCGVKLFFEMNYDWLWMMDDDGYPDRECLKHLEKHKTTGAFLNSLVIDEENKGKLAFGLFGKRHNSLILTKEDANKLSDNGLIIGAANPFNGTFVSRNLVNSIGFPLYQMYGWGVEVEYEKRALKNEFLVATIVEAFHFHPKGRVEQVSILNGRYKLNLQSNKFKNYIDLRNSSYIWSRYGGRMSVVKLFVAYTYFFVTRMKFLGYLNFLIAFCHGIIGHWGYEKKYLK
jgi:rhamnopyranosyl-N-acetylglucosaminyl-diphospho-decaprenol beta-1,3/1,4-galactofuranosyltransferase